MPEPLSTCKDCGEPPHLGLCKPALAVLYATERDEHDRDRAMMARLELENADLRQQLLDYRLAHP